MWDRPAPSIVPTARTLVAEKFRQNQHVTDLKLLDVMRYKAEMELEETLEKFKTRSHIWEILMEEQNPALPEKKGPFLDTFFSGKK